MEGLSLEEPEQHDIGGTGGEAAITTSSSTATSSSTIMVTTTSPSTVTSTSSFVSHGQQSSSRVEERAAAGVTHDQQSISHLDGRVAAGDSPHEVPSTHHNFRHQVSPSQGSTHPPHPAFQQHQSFGQPDPYDQHFGTTNSKAPIRQPSVFGQNYFSNVPYPSIPNFSHPFQSQPFYQPNVSHQPQSLPPQPHFPFVPAPQLVNLPPPEPPHLSLSAAEGEASWFRFRSTLISYFAALGVSTEPYNSKQCLALFESYLGATNREIFHGLPRVIGVENPLDEAFERIDRYFKPLTNEIFLWRDLHATSQGHEDIDTFLQKLKAKARKIKFGVDQEEKHLLYSFVLGLSDPSLKQRLMVKENLTLEWAVKTARASETARRQLQILDGSLKSQEPTDRHCFYQEQQAGRDTRSQSRSPHFRQPRSPSRDFRQSCSPQFRQPRSPPRDFRQSRSPRREYQQLRSPNRDFKQKRSPPNESPSYRYDTSRHNEQHSSYRDSKRQQSSTYNRDRSPRNYSNQYRSSDYSRSRYDTRSPSPRDSYRGYRQPYRSPTNSPTHDRHFASTKQDPIDRHVHFSGQAFATTHDLDEPKLLPIEIDDQLQSQTIYGLMDTGSAASLMSDSFYKSSLSHHRLERKPISIRTANQQVMCAIGTITVHGIVPCSDGGVRMPITFVVVKNLAVDIILGRDFMSSFKVTFVGGTTTDEGARKPSLVLHTSYGSDGCENIVKQFSSIFDKPLAEAVLSHEMYQPTSCIHLHPGAQPKRANIRSTPHHLKNCVTSKVSELLENGVIRKCQQSEWRSNVVCVPKRGTDEMRMTVNYRSLNAVTKLDSYPVPLISELLGKCASMTLFSSLDFSQFYHQLPLVQEDIEKTAFVANGELYEYLRLPFGLKNGVAYCSRVMNSLFGDMEGVAIYLDDLIIMGRDKEEHNRRLEAVLSRIHQAGLSLNRRKCKFGASSISFLGHVIQNGTVRPDPSRTEAVIKYKSPSNHTELQRFLGFASYHRSYVKNFAAVAKPLHDLMKYEEFDWSDEHENAVNDIKQAIVDALLVIPDLTKRFKLECDASGSAIGGILTQDGHPVSYYSRLLQGSELNYPIIEKEALAIIDSVRKFREFLLAREFDLITDQRALSFIFERAQTNAKMWRWRIELEEFNYSISYRPGKQNIVADALSRCLNCMLVQLDCNLKDRIAAEQKNDDSCVLLTDAILDGTIDTLRAEDFPDTEYYYKRNSLKLTHDNILILNFKRKSPRFVVPPSLRQEIMSICHGPAHRGRDATFDTVIQEFWWPHLYSDVDSFVRSCEVCCRQKITWAKPPPSFLPIPDKAFKCVAMDFVGPLPVTSTGKRYQLVFIDRLTRYAEVYATRDMSTVTVKDCLIDLFARHGYPNDLLSDRGGNFESKDIAAFLKSLNVHKTRTTAYSPNGNGICERFNKTLNQKIKYIQAEHNLPPSSWHVCMTAALSDYRSARHSSTGFSPRYLLYHASATEMKQAKQNVKNNIEGNRRQQRLTTWQPQLNDRVLVRSHSHVLKGHLPSHRESTVIQILSPQVVRLADGGTVAVKHIGRLPQQKPSTSLQGPGVRSTTSRPTAESVSVPRPPLSPDTSSVRGRRPEIGTPRSSSSPGTPSVRRLEIDTPPISSGTQLSTSAISPGVRSRSSVSTTSMPRLSPHPIDQFDVSMPINDGVSSTMSSPPIIQPAIVIDRSDNEPTPVVPLRRSTRDRQQPNRFDSTSYFASETFV